MEEKWLLKVFSIIFLSVELLLSVDNAQPNAERNQTSGMNISGDEQVWEGSNRNE